MSHVIFAPGLFAISFLGPWMRAVLVVALFAAATAAAGLMGTTAVTPWLLFALAAYVFGAVVEWGLIGTIRIRRTMERIASGDLSVRIELKNTRGSDAIRMWRSIDSMSASLAAIVRQVNESSGIIGKAAHEVGQGYQNLSRRTEEQAATLEETASSTEELTATVRQNAESCGRARELAAEASGVAAQAAEAMRRMTGTMGRIEGSSRRVTEISGVIESIAFQTNILALNAAVEAARAGEHGRGFAVVAAEVRDLAQRCSVAAKEIREVIGDSSTAVTEGGKIAGEAAQTIDRAVASVHAVSEQIDAIARASSEQSTGIEGISKAIQQLDGVTAQNAALVEQTGAAARAFEEQTSRLVEVVGFFKVDLSKEREAAVAMVKKGIARMHAAGNEAAFREFEDRKGEFRRGGNYLWVCDMKGTVRCHGTYPKSRNQNHADLKDANGKLFIRDVLRIAAERGLGWVDYQYHNPATKHVEPKSTYFERAGDLIVLCGVYRHEGHGAAVPLASPAAALPAASKGARKHLALR